MYHYNDEYLLNIKKKFVLNPIKVAQWKNGCMKKPTANLNFLFLLLFVYPLKNCSSQFFSNSKSAEPVFCSEELSCLPYKNQNKNPNSQGKFKFAIL